MPHLNLKDLESPDPKVKYACAKQAVRLSQANPQALYGNLDYFVHLVSSDKRIIQWTAIAVIGNLSWVDKTKAIDPLLSRFFGYLRSRDMITAANTTKALGVIAQSKPHLQEAIYRELLRVEKTKYYHKGELSPECRNVVLGEVLNVLGDLASTWKSDRKITNFIRRQIKNSRPVVSRRAKKLLDLAQE